MITITGATGQLGRHTITQLLSRIDAASLSAVVRSPEKASDLADSGLKIVQGDYDTPAQLEQAFAGTDVLFFISNTDVQRRQQQHQNVIDAAKAASVGRVVYTSFVQTGRQDPLTMSHAATEAAIKASGLSYTFLRNNFYMDMYVAEVEIAGARGVYQTPTDASAGVALVRREDIARAAATVLVEEGHEGKTYDMTGPQAVTPAVIAQTASSIYGKPVEHQQIAWDELADEYRRREMPEPYVQLSILLERMIASNDLAGVSQDIERLTGTPAMGFEAFVRSILPGR